MSKPKTFEQRSQQILNTAQAAADNHSSWVEANNQIFGIGGLLGELFPDKQERMRFASSPAFLQINDLLATLMPKESSRFSSQIAAASGKMTLRLPKSLHASLQLEAEAEGISLNQLILTKLACQLGDLVKR